MGPFWTTFLRPFLIFWSVIFAMTIAAGMAARSETARCGGYADVLADLASSYHERVVWVGQRGEAGQLIITANADGTSWTALLVRGEIACLATAGVGWAAKLQAAGEDI